VSGSTIECSGTIFLGEIRSACAVKFWRLGNLPWSWMHFFDSGPPQMAPAVSHAVLLNATRTPEKGK
jgi:hypothetical protein